MNEMKHTPGPWVFLEEGRTEEYPNAGYPLNICGPSDDSDLIAEIYSSDDATVATPRAQAIANARLIAAAPDLLAALEEARDGLRWYQDSFPQATDGSDDEAMARIEAALSKAAPKGEESKNG